MNPTRLVIVSKQQFRARWATPLPLRNLAASKRRFRKIRFGIQQYDFKIVCKTLQSNKGMRTRARSPYVLLKG